MTQPTRIKVGVPRRGARPPLVARPPTEPSEATAQNYRSYTNTGGAATTSPDWWIPFGLTVGDLIFVCINVDDAETVSGIPSGYTLETAGLTQNLIYTKVADGTEVDTTFTLGSAKQINYSTWRVQSNGVNFTTFGPDGTYDTADIDPPSAAPTSFPQDSLVFVVWNYNKGETTVGPSGYTEVVDESDLGDLDPHQKVWVQAIDNVTSEDPGTITHVDTAGSRVYRMNTVVVRRKAAPALATSDHVHALDDLSDVDLVTTPPTSSEALVWDGADWVPGSSGGPSVLTFSWPGDASVSSGVLEVPLQAGTLSNMRVRAATAPTGSSLIANFDLNGATLGNMTIAAAANDSGTSTPSTTTVVDGDYLSVEFTQVGSTLPGSNLVFTIEWSGT